MNKKGVLRKKIQWYVSRNKPAPRNAVFTMMIISDPDMKRILGNRI